VVTTAVILAMEVFLRRFKLNMERVIYIPCDRCLEFDPAVVSKNKSRGLSIEKIVIFLYAKSMSVSDNEDELRDIYEINLSFTQICIVHQIRNSCRYVVWKDERFTSDMKGLYTAVNREQAASVLAHFEQKWGSKIATS